MKKTYTRRSFLKGLASISLGSLLTTSFGYTYAKYIEPRRLQIVRHTITSKNIPKSFNGIKILQFSDIHLGLSYDLLQLEQLMVTINNLKPTLILFTGDLMDVPNEYPHPERIPPILQRLQAPLGKYAIYGNHDHGGYGTNIYKQAIEDAGFRLLVNEVDTVFMPDKSYIHICGLDDIMLGNPQYEGTLGQLQPDIFSIAMIHEPDVAVKAAPFPVDLQLSGHSHGGQIQIPFYGPLITPPFGTVYPEGMYEVGDSKMKLYVNRGLGTTRIPFRFLATPEITLFTLQST
ncbi:metallophosphoesterase [Priestia megaterium]|uniref:metallophosphoesterase n=1 Tax=Priestia megaterium TaxID=1404 RepID=UPI0021ACF463|nr:metallophosphoesterase [Priestia megaterium]MCR8929353.1 metallophosphoesterase [Priestia megaterium]